MSTHTYSLSHSSHAHAHAHTHTHTHSTHAHTQTLSVTTHIPRDRRDAVTEDILTKPDSKEKVEEVTFSCPQVFQVQTWHHVVIVVNKTLRGKARVTLYVDSNQIGAPEKVCLCFSCFCLLLLFFGGGGGLSLVYTSS